MLAGSPSIRSAGGVEKDKGEKSPTIRELYPDFTEDQLPEAAANLEQYLDLILRIYERIEADPEALADLRRITRELRQHKEDKAAGSV